MAAAAELGLWLVAVGGVLDAGCGLAGVAWLEGWGASGAEVAAWVAGAAPVRCAPAGVAPRVGVRVTEAWAGLLAALLLLPLPNVQ